MDDTLRVLGTSVLAYPYYFHALIGWGFHNVVPDVGDTMLSITKRAKKRNDVAMKKK